MVPYDGAGTSYIYIMYIMYIILMQISFQQFQERPGAAGEVLVKRLKMALKCTKECTTMHYNHVKMH